MQPFAKDPTAGASSVSAEGDGMNNLRVLVPMTDSEIETLFARLGYSVCIADLAFTAETIDDFWFARYDAWDDPGTVVRHEPGLLIIRSVRPRGSSVPRDVVVVGFVMVRVALGVDREPNDLFADLPGMPIARTLLLATAPQKEPA